MFPYQELSDSLRLDFASAGIGFLDAPLSSDMSVQEIRVRMLHRSFLKKLSPAGLSPEADSAALEKFIAINESVSIEPFEYPVESEQDALFWAYFRDNFLKTCTPSDVDFDLAYMRETFAAGPGASRDA